MSKRIDLTGKTFGDFTALEYLGKKTYKIKCNICGEEKEIATNNMQRCAGVTCSKKKPPVEDITGRQFGHWTVLKYVGKKKYLCRCDCENKTEKEVYKANLISGTSTSCGHDKNHYGDLTGKRFGDWLVLGKEKDGYRWVCQCQCEKKKISFNSAYDLCTGKTKSCGHGYNEFYDISGQQFGLWKVLEYEWNQHYKCECQCENKTISSIRKADLLSGATTSCGCNKGAKARETLIQRYGEVGPNRIGNPRTAEQINAVASKENLEKFILDLGYKPTLNELSNMLDIMEGMLLVKIRKFGLIDLIDYNVMSHVSQYEKEIARFINKECGCDIELRDRQILKGKELDIYIPEKKLAIEFNGSYWHSTIFKDKLYHQQKTLECAYKGIQLIHIFEYEWLNEKTQAQIKALLKAKLSNEYKRVYARNTIVREVDGKQSKEFLEKYHLQGNVNASINIGMFYENELIGVMTFSKPRYDKNYAYEIIRLCYKDNIKVIGGTEKLFKYFIKRYKPDSIMTYADISKFTGNVYTRIGFKLVEDKCITVPNYIWTYPNNNEVLKRYSTQKHKLLEQGLGEYGNTEDEIMTNLGYMKIYDSGNLKLEWYK